MSSGDGRCTSSGLVRLRMGDLTGAEAAFSEAHGLGWDPQPGLALLRLAQGDVAAAATPSGRRSSIRRRSPRGSGRRIPISVCHRSTKRRSRSRWRPVRAASRTSAAELERIAETTGTKGSELRPPSHAARSQLLDGESTARPRASSKPWGCGRTWPSRTRRRGLACGSPPRTCGGSARSRCDRARGGERYLRAARRQDRRERQPRRMRSYDARTRRSARARSSCSPTSFGRRNWCA